MSSATQLYEISTRLAVGDAGLIYKATERASGRTVVLKLLLPDEQISHPLDVEALLRDAPAISLMTGDNIVHLLNAFQDEDGVVLVYEFAEGTRGLDVPAICPIPAAQSVEVAAQLLTALSCGERQQYPHGDLKPSDISLMHLPDGRPFLKVLDWGLANYRKEPTPAALPYTAPERLTGAPPSHAADLFSAGAVLYYLFTGEQAVTASSREEYSTAWRLLNPHVLHHLRPDLPAALINWIARLLQPNPSERPSSAAESLSELSAINPSQPPFTPESAAFRAAPLQQQQLQPRPPATGSFPNPMPRPGGARRQFLPPPQKKRSSAGLVTSVVLFLAFGVGGFALWQSLQPGKKTKLAKVPVEPSKSSLPAAPQPPMPEVPSKTAASSAVVAALPPVLPDTPPPAPVEAVSKPLANTATVAEGAIFASSAAPPAVDSYDIANLAAQKGTDKWFFQSGDERYGADAAKGQTFMIGTAPLLFKALTYKIASGSKKSASPENPTTWTIRLGTVSGKNFTEITTKQAEQTADMGAGDYVTWTFTTPVPLAADTTYAVDVAMRSRTVWTTGLPYLATSANVTTQGVGVHYNSGDRGIGGSTIETSVGIDRIFHVDLEAQ